MKILHIASFTGNIGDNASHAGFYSMLNQSFESPFKFEQVEIRKFYQSYDRPDKRKFDDQFANYANTFDAVFIGGGGFLDYWIKGSKTGTTLDVSLDTLDKIKVPIIIGSIGSMPHKEVPEENYRKFENFLGYVRQRDDLHILLRNDGSRANLAETFGESLIEGITEILDHGFFYEPMDKTSFAEQQPPYILFNTTVDQLRMMNEKNEITEQEFESQIRQVVNHIIQHTEYQIIFVPHIYKDIDSFTRILSGIDDFHLRSRIQIAPYMQGDRGAEVLFSLYRHSVMNIGMRFHANVCSLAFGKPTIGLVALPRVENLHLHIGSSSFIHLNKKMATNIIDRLDANPAESISRTNIAEQKEKTITVYTNIFGKQERSKS